LIEAMTVNHPEDDEVDYSLPPITDEVVAEEDLLASAAPTLSGAVFNALMAAMTFGALTSMAMAFGRLLLRHI
jgi:hypothetical protein